MLHSYQCFCLALQSLLEDVGSLCHTVAHFSLKSLQALLSLPPPFCLELLS